MARGYVYEIDARVHIFDPQLPREETLRISLEETTPLHKQHNCVGVRASITPASLGDEQRGEGGGGREV